MSLVDADPRRAARRVRRTLDDAGAGLVGRRVLALCSGGIDSTVLVALLARLPRGAAPASIDVLFLDHGLRDASVDAERAAARAVAEIHGFAFHERRRAAVEAGNGVQDSARTWRYSTALDVATQLGGRDVVVTGHTADDQLECALLGLIGATSAQPTTMPVARALSTTVRLVRPLLGLTRVDIERIAASLSIEHVEDPSNADPDAYLRNALRHRVVPQLLDVHPGAGAVLARSADRARERSAANAGMADALLATWGVEPGAERIDVRRVLALAPEARRAVLERWLRRSAAGQAAGRAIDARTVRSVEALAVLPGRAACARVDLAGDACVRRDGYSLHVSVTSAPTGEDHL